MPQNLFRFQLHNPRLLRPLKFPYCLWSLLLLLPLPSPRPYAGGLAVAPSAPETEQIPTTLSEQVAKVIEQVAAPSAEIS